MKDFTGRSTALRTDEELNRVEPARRLAFGAENPDGNILYDEARTLERSVVRGHVVGKQQSFLHNARKRAQPKMDGVDFETAAAFGFFLRGLHDAHRDGKFVHGGRQVHSSAFAEARAAGKQACLLYGVRGDEYHLVLAPGARARASGQGSGALCRESPLSDLRTPPAKEVKMIDLKTNYLGLNLRTPVVPSASPFTHELDNIRRLEDAGAAAIVFHSVFEERAKGAAGIPPELEVYLNQLRKAKGAVAIPVIANLRGSTREGWQEFGRQIEQAGADALECNLYHVPSEQETSSAELEQGYVDTVKAVKSTLKIPVAAKISPFFTGLMNVARRFDDAGVSGLVLFNRFYQPDIDLDAMEIQPSVLLSTTQDLRLPLTWIGILHGRVRASLAGTSGVQGAEDVVKLLLAGADAVMVCSTLLRNGIDHLRKIESGLSEWMEKHKYSSVGEMKGKLSQLRCPDPTAFERAQYMNAVKGVQNVVMTGKEAWRFLSGN